MEKCEICKEDMLILCGTWYVTKSGCSGERKFAHYNCFKEVKEKKDKVLYIQRYGDKNGI